MSNNVEVQLPAWASELWKPYRFKALHGGRAAAKSRTVGTILPILAAQKKMRILCAREVQLTIKQSSKKLIEMQIERMGMQNDFKVTTTGIFNTRTGSEFMFFGLRDQDPDKIKSLESIDLVWLEEAHTISQNSLDILIPTIRNEGSEIWLTWNDRSKTDAVSQMFVENDHPPNSLVMKVNWDSNPFFPEVLREEMEHCKATDSAKYLHVWEGHYLSITEGSFYAKELTDVLNEGRLLNWDFKDTGDDIDTCVWMDLGANDYTSCWFGKFVKNPVGEDEIHLILYYENHFAHIEHYIDYIKSQPFKYKMIYLPHDANNKTIATKKSAYEYVRDSGLPVSVIPRTKSVRDDIDGVKRVLPLCYFHKDNTERGVEHLMAYRRKQDPQTGIFTERAVHDLASHGADAMRYLAVTHPLNARSREIIKTKIGGV